MKNLLIILTLMVACTKEDSAVPTITLGNKIEATYDTEVAYQEGIKVKITKIEDSRCPKNVTCVWMGSVKINLTISNLNTSQEVMMEVMGDYSKPTPANVQFGNQWYVIDISQVLPYPENTTEIMLKDYKITLTVKKM
jgi:hypothetical protein